MGLVVALTGSALAMFLVVACSSSSKPPSITTTLNPDAGQNDRDAYVADGATQTVDASDAASAVDVDECHDGIKDGMETDIDCGGPRCGACANTKTCVENSDCTGLYCQPGTTKTCATATCMDGARDQDESDVDCGGATCPACTVGKSCTKASDCRSSQCNANSCACPSSMVIVPSASAAGGGYCIDVTEVDQGAYNAFIDSNQPTANQPNGCSGNTSYVPQDDWPPSLPTNQSFNKPIHFVDWCDAQAYCKWAGKSLCGQIGGGPDVYTAPDAGDVDGGSNDTHASAWFNACSAQGANEYPYSHATFNPLTCNGGPRTDGGTAAIANDGLYTTSTEPSTCQGGVVGLYDMSGNVAEWEDSCTNTGVAATGSDSCRVRGGSYLSNNDPVALSCAGERAENRLAAEADVGFRCCVY